MFSIKFDSEFQRLENSEKRQNRESLPTSFFLSIQHLMIINSVVWSIELTKECEVWRGIADEFDERFPHSLWEWPPGSYNITDAEHWKQQTHATNFQTLKEYSNKKYLSVFGYSKHISVWYIDESSISCNIILFMATESKVQRLIGLLCLVEYCWSSSVILRAVFCIIDL